MLSCIILTLREKFKHQPKGLRDKTQTHMEKRKRKKKDWRTHLDALQQGAFSLSFCDNPLNPPCVPGSTKDRIPAYKSDSAT